MADNTIMDGFIRSVAGEVRGGEGHWTFTVSGIPLICYTSEEHARMRIISPVVSAEGLTRDALYELLAANFDRALDAKYAIWQAQLWSTFVHPLTDLTERLFRNAVAQVVNLHRNYGTTFASCDEQFEDRELEVAD